MKILVFFAIAFSLFILKTDTTLSSKKSFEGKQLFEENCSVCHLPVDVLAGPPLTFISDYKELEWFIDYKSNPLKYSKNNLDSYTTKMLNYWMPSLAIEPPTVLNKEQLSEIWYYLEDLKSTTSRNPKIDSLRTIWTK